MDSLHHSFMQEALRQAALSVEQGGFPAGSVIVRDNEIIGRGISIGNILNDPTSHSDIAAIRDSCKNLQTSDLSGATLYSSLEPCLMCLSAAGWGNIGAIVFACVREKVSPDYYGGHHATHAILKDMARPIEIIHVAASEEESLAIIHQWERNLTP